jgi:phosphohistidine phosphatase SixA
MHRRHLLGAAAGFGFGLGPAAAAANTARIDYPALLRSHGLVVMLRHAATEPGIGDPPGYRLDDCASQRNLSAEGRAQASRLGRVLAGQGLRPARVLSSRWCRCQDTARLAFGTTADWPALDSFFDDRPQEPAQTAALRDALGRLVPGEVVAWVTHMVNIAALTGDTLAMGEALVLRADRQRDGQVQVLRLGRIDTAAQG